MNLKEKLNLETASVAVGVTLAILLIIACVIFGPLAVIWSINTLLPVAAIPYNFFTWLAVVVLYLFTKSSVSIKK